MILTSGFRKILQGGYDKLSIHKMFSIEITLEIPVNLQVFVRSNMPSVLETRQVNLTSINGNISVPEN
jgi:hypothetical protein